MEKQAVLEIIAQLLILQECDGRIAQCQQELNNCPALKKSIADQLAQTQATVAAAQEQLNAKQLSIKQLELEIESLRQQIIKLREQQYQIKSNEEYRALNNEIANLQNKIGALEDNVLELMEQNEQAQQELKRRQAEVVSAENLAQERLQKLEQLRLSWEEEIRQTHAKRAALAGTIEPSWLGHYNHVMKHKKDVALVSIINNACGRCHMKLPPQVIHDTRKAEAIVTCSYCGRILYWTR